MVAGHKDQQWATKCIVTADEGKYVADSIMQGESIAISDISYKNNQGTAACVIEGIRPGHKSVYASATIPGKLVDHDSYRFELTGIYTTCMVVNEICALHNVENGKKQWHMIV
eukprot:2306131-Ditylum_brightwellii.AAC.1